MKMAERSWFSDARWLFPKVSVEDATDGLCVHPFSVWADEV